MTETVSERAALERSATPRSISRFLWRATVITHRYLGVAVGLLMLVWFASGIVMMYVPYPGVSGSDRLKFSPPIAWQACCALLAQPYGEEEPIRSVVVRSLAGEPVLEVRRDGQPPRLTGLASANALASTSAVIDENSARAVASMAAAGTIGPEARLIAEGVIERDQWTVGEAGAGHRPLYFYRFDDPNRTTFYVSGTSGEIVQWTTASLRFWNWLGAIPHWIYFTELRANVALWTQVTIWTSMLGAFLTVLGLYLGIAQFKRGRSGRLSPYRGWFYWHHIVGLVFGIVTLTWAVSGTVSVNPWGLLESEPGNERERLAGEPIAWREVRASLETLKANPPAGDVVRVESAALGGGLFWLTMNRDGEMERRDSAGCLAPLATDELAAAAERLAGANGIASQAMLNTGDAYYFDFIGFAQRDPLQFPIYRVVLNDRDRTRYYLDPRSGNLLRKADASARNYRWLFGGLHRFDFTPWLRVRPVWDLTVLLLMLGGLAGTVTGVYLACWRLKRDFTFKRRM